jgi:hypothetical protein
MAAREPDPREAHEWRVEVDLEADEHGQSLGERLRSLDLDDEARKRLGGSVIVTRDGPNLFAYAWHEQGAQEAERVIRDLMEEDELAGRVSVTRWHPVADEWRPASEPLPETGTELSEEQSASERAGEAEHTQTGQYPWEVVIDLPDLRSTRELAQELIERGLPVKRRFKYLLVGQPSEEKAVELGRSFEGKVPDGSHVSVRGNPHDLSSPGFVLLGSLKPGVMRDFGL